MRKYKVDWIRKAAWFVLGSCLMVWGYARQSGNPAVGQREGRTGEVKKPLGNPVEISLEPDLPEISSGTQ